MIDTAKIQRSFFAILLAGLFFIMPFVASAEESAITGRGVIDYNGRTWAAFGGWTGEVNVESGDLNNNGYKEVVATMGPGGGPHVRIFSSTGKLLGQFDAYNPNFRGGVNLAIGDINNDNMAEIVTGAGPGGGSHVRVFNHRGEILEEWFAFESGFRGGVIVSIENGKIATRRGGQANDSFEINAPMHHQEHNLSCEVASLRSALLYRGIGVSEAELIRQQPVSKPLEFKNGVWGDPSKGYVGDIDGSQPRLTGYGIYWQPIAELARKYRPAESFRHVDWPFIKTNVLSGNPTIVWGNYNQNPQTLIWKTSQGAGVLGFIGEHTYIVLGWEGDPNHPDKIILLDPMRGRLTMSFADFMQNWSYLDYSGVVVY